MTRPSVIDLILQFLTLSQVWPPVVPGYEDGKRQKRLPFKSLELAQTARDLACQQHSYSLYLRVLAQQRRQRAALALDVPSLRSAPPGARAEVLSSRSFLHRLEESTRLDGSHTMWRLFTCRLSDSAPRQPYGRSRPEALQPDTIERMIELEEAAFATGAVDLLVTAYRSTPDLLPVLLRASREKERLCWLLKQAGDEQLMVAAGHRHPAEDDPKGRLTSREYEVYELIGQGLTEPSNRSTPLHKRGHRQAHVHHVYDKLGIRSRAAVAVLAALDRADQATRRLKAASSAPNS